MKMRLIQASVLLFFLLAFAGCNVQYSFTGTSLPPEVATVSVQFFPSYAPLAQPNLSQEFTEALRDIFLSQTRLALVKTGGDIQYEGEITGYQTRPAAIQGNETAALNRLTITVKVRFVNLVDEEQNFEQSFSQFADFDASQNISAVEDQLIEQINEQLVQDIFNRSVSNW